MAELDVVISRLEQLDKRLDDRFHAVHTRLDDMTQRLNTIENRLTSLDGRVDGKAGTGLVNFWGGFVTAWTSILVGTVIALMKLWP